MGAKEDALAELNKLIKEAGLSRSTVGRQITGDPTFLNRLEDPNKSITTKTLDAVHRYVLSLRRKLDLEKGKK